MKENTRDAEDILWFGTESPLSDLSLEIAARKIRAYGDTATADQLATAAAETPGGTFGHRRGLFGSLFNRYVRTTNVCGFLPTTGKQLIPVSETKPDPSLKEKPLKVTLDGLHVANYPGFGTHRLLFDFALQTQVKGKTGIFHYNARFEARDGETVPVRNFPIFYGLKPSVEGLTFGFQTENLASGFDEGLLDFLKKDEFKAGLDLATSVTPVLGQISEMAASLTRWLAGQSNNAKVQEFRQGLDFERRAFGGGLALGSYVVIQIPANSELEWNWSDWAVDPSSLHLVRRNEPSQRLEYNYLVFGLHRLKE